MTGAPPDGDRAGGLRPEPAAQSQPEALIPSVKLLEQIENALSGARDLDWMIHLRNGLDGVGFYGCQKHYTTSIDAAMTLVPTGFEVSLYGAVGSFSPQAQLETQQMRDRFQEPVSGRGATIALALCAAAVRSQGIDARSGQTEGLDPKGESPVGVADAPERTVP